MSRDIVTTSSGAVYFISPSNNKFNVVRLASDGSRTVWYDCDVQVYGRLFIVRDNKTLWRSTSIKGIVFGRCPMPHRAARPRAV